MLYLKIFTDTGIINLDESKYSKEYLIGLFNDIDHDEIWDTNIE